jgi:hypothetical protein
MLSNSEVQIFSHVFEIRTLKFSEKFLPKPTQDSSNTDPNSSVPLTRSCPLGGAVLVFSEKQTLY